MNPKFFFESQFSDPLEYYKSYLLLMRLNKKIKLSEFCYNSKNLEALVDFCKINKLEIVGAEIQKYSYTGGNVLSLSDTANMLNEKLKIESDGNVYNYGIYDNDLNNAASIICIKCPADPVGCKTMTQSDFENIIYTEDLEYYLTPVEKDKKFDPENVKTELIIAKLLITVSKVVIRKIRNNSWEYIDFVNKPVGSAANEWILDSPELQKFKDEDMKIYPAIRIDPSALKTAFGNSDLIQTFKPFDVPLNSHMMYCQMEAMEENVPDGFCLNCFGKDITRGDLVLCLNCDSDILLFFDDNFPWNDEMKDEITNYADQLWEL